MIKILLLAGAAIGCGALMQHVYESNGGLTFDDMTKMVSDGTKAVENATSSAESAARTVGAAATATTDGAARVYDSIGDAAKDGKEAVDGAVSMVTNAFASTPPPSTSAAPSQRDQSTTSMPVKRSAMNIKPVDLPPIERDTGDER